jgi:parallel beta-helix repeat protein
MLDAPGEWCVEQGRLVVWPHDGNSPDGRTSAAVHGPAINANNADSILIDNIKIKTATIGVEANNSHHLQMNNTQFEQIGEEAIIVGGKDIHLERIQINQTGLNGLRFTDDARQIIVRDSTIQGAGMLGLPKRSKGAIVLEHAEQVQIIGNTIKDSAYIGIRIFRNAVVENNHIGRACLRLTDCAGIYTFARDGLPLNSNIINNDISQTQGRFSFGIYLDDQANHVQVIKNKISHNAGGMQLHNAYNNLIQENVFFKNKNQQILFNETSDYPLMHDNHIANNNFSTDDNVPVYRLWSSLGEKSIYNFGVYKANTYSGVQNKFAECTGSGMIAWKNWKQRMQDTSLFQF